VLLMYLWTATFCGLVVGLSVLRIELIWFALATLVAMAALLFATAPRLRPWRSTGGHKHRRLTAGPVRSAEPASVTTRTAAAARGPAPRG